MIAAQIALVGCGKTKRAEASEVADLYTGSLFRKSLAYARSLSPDLLRVVSALHGALEIDRVVRPYDFTMYEMTSGERAAWGERIAKQIENAIDPSRERCTTSYGKPRTDLRASVVVLAGRFYSDALRAPFELRGWEIIEPLRGMQIGERLQWLTRTMGTIEVAA